MIRTVWSLGIIVVSTLLFSSIALGGAILRVRNPAFYDWTARTWSKWILWSSGSPVRVEGLQHIDPDSAQVLAGNHQSWFDVPAVAAHLTKNFHFVAKKELERIPIFGQAWKLAGHISIDRKDRESALRSLEQAARQLRDDASAVVIFPEGTRAETDELQPFKKGAFLLALHAGVPVVPFAVAGTRRVMAKGSWRVRNEPIIVRFGEPIPTADLRANDRDLLRERVEDQVRRLRDEARAELGPGRLEQIPDAHGPGD